jgi:hypothetical protein
VEDDDRPGRFSRDDFSSAVPGSLERSPHVSCREIAKDLFVPMTIISRILEEKVQDSSLQDECPTSDRLSRRRTEWRFVKRYWRF